MGLDTVELLIDIEERFGIEISNKEASEIITVGDFANTVYSKLNMKPSQKCLQLITFNRLRRAFLDFGIKKDKIKPQTIIFDILPKNNILNEWNEIEKKIKLKMPKLVKRDINKELESHVTIFGMRIYKRTEPLTENKIAKLIDWIISLNFTELTPFDSISNKYEVERIISGIICERMGIPINEIELHYSITNDLGIE